jgi:hypothetical protein
MSTPILPFAVWASGTNQNAIPANDNALRAEILQRNVNNATTAQPGSPADGDTYIIQATHTGTQWATFTPKDLAIYKGGTWYAFAPVEGVKVTVSGAVYIYTAGAWAAASSGGTVRNPSVVSALSTSGSVAIDYSLGDYFTLALAGNVSGFTFSNLPGAGKGASLMVRITQDATARTVAWPASFKWAGGTAGAVSTASGAVDVLAITTFDNGTTWDATLAKAFA